MDHSTRKVLEREHAWYIRNVSTEGHAASLETSIFLMKLLLEARPMRIADLGSGFTSFVCRYYQAKSKAPPLVVSVDDKEAWLEKTERYLAMHNLSLDDLQLWQEFRETSERFDLIVYDLGTMPTRIACIDEVLALLGTHGMAILDDAHFDEKYSRRCGIESEPFYADVISLALEDHGLKRRVLTETIDRYGRFSILAYR